VEIYQGVALGRSTLRSAHAAGLVVTSRTVSAPFYTLEVDSVSYYRCELCS